MNECLSRGVAGLALVLLSGACVAAEESAAGPALELNRLQAVDDGCRMHVVVSNEQPVRHDKFQLDLVVFDGDGLIARRVALDTSPVRPKKTSVYAFDVKGLECAKVGRVLLNDVVGCSGGDGDCVGTVSVSSRAGVPFEK